MKLRTQTIILVVGIALMMGKFGAYYLTDSVGILTDAMESIVNVLAGAMSLWGLWLAAKPKDKKHPFGHGKIELLTASIEAILIITAGGLIIWEGVARILAPVMPERLDLGIVIIAVAGAVNWVLGAWSRRVAKRCNSIALEAEGRHLQSDTYSTIGLIVGLVLLYITDIAWIDGALALIFGGIIIYTGIGILRQTFSNLLDASDEVMLARIAEHLQSVRHDDWIDIHELRVISYGELLHIDCHLTLPSIYDIAHAHDRADELEAHIGEAVAPRTAMISVHIDPCDQRMCGGCGNGGCSTHYLGRIDKQPFTAASITRDDNERNALLESISKS